MSDLFQMRSTAEFEKAVMSNPQSTVTADQEGRIPLHIWAAKDCRDYFPKLVKATVSAGGSVDHTSHQSRTPLHYAAIAGNARNVGTLLENNASPFVQDTVSGRFAIHYAAALPKSDCLVRLLGSGHPQALANLLDYLGHTPLHEACRQNRANIVALLLDAGADPNMRDLGCPTALHVAAETGSVECARLLINSGANMTARMRSGIIPLHVAAASGHKDVVQLFLQRGVQIDFQYPESGTALFYATRANMEDMITFLEAEGADVSLKGEHGATPLHVAAQLGELSLCRLLVSLGANITDKDALERTPLHVAAQFGYETIVDYLVKKGPHTLEYMSKSDYTPVEVAAFYQHPGIQQILMSRMWINNSWKTDHGMKRIHLSSCSGHSNDLRAVLSDDSVKVNDADRCRRTPLQWAISCKNSECIEMLLAAKASATRKGPKGLTAFHLACRQGLLNTVTRMLELPEVDAELKTKAGENALHFAAVSGNADLVSLLVKAGFKIDEADNSGNTPLHRALVSGCIGCAELLLFHGASVTATNKYGETCLHYAARSCQNVNVLQKCLKSANAASSKKTTPLHVACIFSNTSAVDFLLKNKADPFIPDAAGYTALEYAVMAGCVGSVVTILKATAKAPGGEEELHHAVRLGRIECLDVLLRCEDGARFGKFINATNSNGESAVQIAIKNCRTRCLQSLILTRKIICEAEGDENSMSGWLTLCSNAGPCGRDCSKVLERMRWLILEEK